jgi:hypothetical protein
VNGRSTTQTVIFWSIVAVTILVCLSIGAYGYFWYAYFFLNRRPSQEQLVPSGYRLIPEARQIDEFFGPAWHKVTNYDAPDLAEWQTEAHFGGRYELLMVVDVRVDRQSGAIAVVGAPRFILREVQAIRGDREVSYRGSSERKFDADQWQKVVEAEGDFSAIGMTLILNKPVPGFDRHWTQPQHGMQFSLPK